MELNLFTGYIVPVGDIIQAQGCHSNFIPMLNSCTFRSIQIMQILT